ncbi:MAG: 2-hydroxyacid dehydrogenase [Thermoprotei archaeon]|nr:2-hydroxyacid dehydrogenase [Thermoprotei archaeon]
MPVQAPGKYMVLSFSPLPAELIKALIAPYRSMLDRDVDVVVFRDVRDWERLSALLKSADVIIGDYTMEVPITREMCYAMEKVRLVAQPSTGFDHIDIDACAEKGVPVANIGGANAVTVAEYTIMVALALLRRLLEAHERTRRGEWPQWELMEKGSFEVQGKTWGIVGLGRIGREVAKRVKAFDANIIYYDKVRFESLEKELGLDYAPLPKLLRTSDIVSLHVPLTPETRRMIGEKELRLMKPTAILINPARGEVVDEEALARALEEKWIAGAAVDVYSREPPGREHPLIKLAARGDLNLIVTPHIGGASTESRARIIQVTIENVLRALRGEKPINVVNMPV